MRRKSARGNGSSRSCGSGPCATASAPESRTPRRIDAWCSNESRVGGLADFVRGRYADEQGGSDVSDDKLETVRSSSSGVIGRAESTAHGARVVLDSSSRPQPDALTNSEAFLAGVSSCGVTLIEMHAQETGIPRTRIDVTIEGVRTAAEPRRFAGRTMTFELAGASATAAAELVDA